MDSTRTVLAEALTYLAAGMSVVPIRPDGTKAPALSSWKQYQQEQPTESDLERWFAAGTKGIAIVGGAVSGGLEVYDFERPAAHQAWRELVEVETSVLLNRLPVVRTPNGIHVYARSPGHVQGSLKLAYEFETDAAGEHVIDPKTKKPKTLVLIETRGEGGYVLAPGCPAACHETGRLYEHVSGPPLVEVPCITEDERAVMLLAARSLNEVAAVAQAWDRPSSNGQIRPGDDYEQKTSWADVLEPAGWTLVRGGGDLQCWRRPGKTIGWSATTGLRSDCGRDLLYVFSSNAAPFASEKSYSKFAAFTHLQHGGDYKAAARALGERGYGAPSRNGKAAARKSSGQGGSERPTKMKPDEIVVVRASDIPPREVEWFWPGRIPMGKLTTFAGVGGLGKTFVLCDLTARVTRGLPWPDANGECCTPGQVLFVSGEDDYDDTLVPRMIELGADLEKVCFLTTEAADRFTLADLPLLDAALEQTGSGVRFVAIDPPTAFLGGINDHKNAELRGLLGPLKSWASRHHVAVVFNTHVTKPQGVKVDAMMRVMGSVAWVNAVRAAHMFTRDPEDADRRLFIPMKNNLGPERKGLAYKLVFEPNRMAKVEWLGEVDTTANDAMSGEKQPARRVLATEWLMGIFKQKLEWPSDEFWASAKQNGVSKNAIDEARVRLGMPKPRVLVSLHGEKSWTWWVPEDWPPLRETKADEVEF